MFNPIKYFTKPKSEYVRILRIKASQFFSFPFRIGKTFFLNMYIAYLPDSYARKGGHGEFPELFKRFTQENTLNNSGDIARVWFFILNIKQVLSEDVQGDIAEVGVWRGNTAAILAHYAKESNRKAYFFDTYEGFDARDLTGIDQHKKVAFGNTTLDTVRSVVGRDNDAYELVKGYFPQVVTETHRNRQYAIVSLDVDLYEPTKAGLDFFYERMPIGGVFFIHDYLSKHWSGVKEAVDEFCARTGERVVVMPDKCGSVLIRRAR